MVLSRNVKVSLALVVAVALAVAVTLVWTARGRDEVAAVAAVPTAQAPPAGGAQAVREDSHVLGSAGSTGVTLVEFLDFECEGCRAAYPFVEQLRLDYEGQVTFVARYFPLPGHFNAMNAALAVEAAAQQGRFEDMYSVMYLTQAEWGEQRVDHAATFRAFAADLGLDLDAYDAALLDPASTERIRADLTDGTALGVQGTPTFFLDGRRLEVSTTDAFRAAIDEALAAAAEQAPAEETDGGTVAGSTEPAAPANTGAGTSADAGAGGGVAIGSSSSSSALSRS